MNLQEINNGLLSYSGLSTWEECPHKFKLLYIEGAPKQGDSIYTMFGHLIHEILATHLPLLHQEQEGRFVELASEDWKKGWARDWKPEFIDPKFKLTEDCYRRFQDEGLALIHNKLIELHYMLKKEWGPYEIIEREHDRSLTYSESPFGIGFRGIIDLVIQTASKQTVILDYKSTKDKSKWRNPSAIKMHQLNLYKMFYTAQAEDRTVNESAFVVIPRNAKDDIQLIKNKVPQEATMQWLDQIVWGIENNIFYKNINRSNCYMCEYNKTKYCNGMKEQEEKEEEK